MTIYFAQDERDYWTSHDEWSPKKIWNYAMGFESVGFKIMISHNCLKGDLASFVEQTIDKVLGHFVDIDIRAEHWEELDDLYPEVFACQKLDSNFFKHVIIPELWLLSKKMKITLSRNTMQQGAGKPPIYILNKLL